MMSKLVIYATNGVLLRGGREDNQPAFGSNTTKRVHTDLGVMRLSKVSCARGYHAGVSSERVIYTLRLWASYVFSCAKLYGNLFCLKSERYLNRRTARLAVSRCGVDDVGISVEELSDAIARDGVDLKVLKNETKTITYHLELNLHCSYKTNLLNLIVSSRYKPQNYLNSPHVESRVLSVDHPKGRVDLAKTRHFAAAAAARSES